MSISNAPSGQRAAAKNIDSILKLEKEDDGRLSPIHRLSHAVGWFAGTIYFVISQCLMVAFWIAWNVGVSAILRPFDPYPFPLLSTVLGLEAVLLTSFVLIRQNAMDLRSERRNHLDLQINLLAEREATSILNGLREISEHLNVARPHDTEREELEQDTAVESIARELRSKEKQT